MMGLGTVTLPGDGSPVTLSRTLDRPFRIERLMVRPAASPVVARWRRIISSAFGWLRVPWLVRSWDDVDERTRWRPRLVRPIATWYARHVNTLICNALDGVQIDRFDVDDQDHFVSPVPANMFSVHAFAVRLHGIYGRKKVSLTFSGVAEPFHVLLHGNAPAIAADEDDEVDGIYDTIDQLLTIGRFDDVDKMLDLVPIPGCSITQLLAYTSITRAARDKLSRRAVFVARVRAELQRLEPARVDALLAGIE
jgi:hypothetical protein